MVKKKNILKNMYLGNFIISDDKKISLSFSIFAVITIPLLSLFFVELDSPFDFTMSYMGNNGHRIFFIIWGNITAVLLGLFAIRTYNTYQYHDKRSRILVGLAYLFLVLTVLLPSVDDLPILASLHTLCAIAFSACFIISLTLFLLYIRSINKKIGLKGLKLYFASIGIPLLALFLFGHCGVYEILFFVTISLFLFNLNYFVLSKNSNILNK